MTRDDFEPTTIREKVVAQFAYVAGWVDRGDNVPGLAADAARRRYPVRERDVPVPRQREREG